jgi:hypothetical protein
MGRRQDWQRERERESGQESKRLRRVVTWIINLTIGQVFMRAWKMDNPEAVFLVMCDPSMNEISAIITRRVVTTESGF